MIVIDQVLISDEVVDEHFVCDLSKCKGGCCEDGDAGAPLETQELDQLIAVYDAVLPYMTPEGIKETERQGKYIYDREFGWVTPTIKGEMCAYGYRDETGTVKCAIEKAYLEGKIEWKKPISCHLFPIRIQRSKQDPDMEYVNYEPREDLCKAACKLGKRLKVPAYVFLKEAIIRKYGEEFYDTLDQTAKHIKDSQ
ncbi:DUF3109 family protein [Deminuibacter soli]|uniref:DUF3109 family protein n=1 Tax=Deminuibacter soli TaxID=2291815 RepID=A0A3E1NDV8_9BACT|nr:DUF3109 family protein [Deminuibacter soli]RFM25958.1 DUF3109 family protein [Deminuibacter soli]